MAATNSGADQVRRLALSQLRPIYRRYKGALEPFRIVAERWLNGSGTGRNAVAVNANELPLALSKLSVPDGIETFRLSALECKRLVAYNDLKEVITVFRDWIESVPRISDRDLVNFIDVYAYCHRHLNGRVVERTPKLPVHKIRSETRYKRAFLQYFNVLCSNGEIIAADEAFSSLSVKSTHYVAKLLSALIRKPSRVELTSDAREQLASRIADGLALAHAHEKIPPILSSLVIAAAKSDGQLFEDEARLRDANAEAARIPYPVSWRVSASLVTIFHLTFKAHGPNKARALLSDVWASLAPDHVAKLELDILENEGQIPTIVEGLKAGRFPEEAARKKLATVRLRQSDFEGALNDLEQVGFRGSFDRKQKLLETIARVRFLRDTSTWLSNVPSPSSPKGYVLLASLNCYNTLAMVTPALIELKKRGYAVGSLMSEMLTEPAVAGVPSEISGLLGCISAKREDGRVLLDWQIDWPGRKVCYGGVNYYEGFYEALSVTFRRGTILLDTRPQQAAFQTHLRRSDYVLRACLKIEAAARAHQGPMVLLGSNSHITPYSIIRDFVLASDLDNLRYVQANNAYQNYYSNLEGKLSRSMAVVDMKLHRTCRAPFIPTRERFENWYAAHGRDEEVKARFEQLLAADRSRREALADDQIATRISAAREAGIEIVCCFGKILCDLTVPYDGGPGHVDMSDWINHTINSVSGRNDILLLIKPHPHELRPEIALELTETLRDVCPAELPENVIFLPHNRFNVMDLAPLIDKGILYNGTSCMELTGLGVPVVMAAYFGRYDYPLGLNYPDSREDYERLIFAQLAPPTEEQRWRSMALLHYMGTDEVAIPNHYSRRPITNDRIGAPSWNAAKMRALISGGDPYISIAADRILEGIPVTGKA